VAMVGWAGFSAWTEWFAATLFLKIFLFYLIQKLI
jgi:hypothetical protein